MNPKIKPFLKWAGGKSQLIDEIEKNLPYDIDICTTYIEPFVGAGALFLHFIENRMFDRYIINDINSKLINLYKVIRDAPAELIDGINSLKIKYIEADEFHREKQFYTIREAFNGECDEVTQAVYMVFLNKTCFNGLYRENSEGKFNVPFGRYKNPNFIDEEQLIELSSLLNIKDETGDFKVKIMNTHFCELKDYIDDNSFIYCDPPYRPVTMGGFNSYDKSGFNDESQIELSKFYRVADAKGARIMLSNSDPKVFDPNDDFFENLYQDFNIKRVRAKRTINSDGRGRGEVEELLITNY